MNLENLPLQDLFNRLRDHGLSLGINEYMAFLRALKAGIGLTNQNEFKQLCMALWVKSDEEVLLFNRLFESLITSNEDEKSKTAIRNSNDTKAEDQPVAESEKQHPSEDYQSENQPSQGISLETNELTQIVQAIRHGRQSQFDLSRPKYSTLTDYFPVTSRQMKQSWRYLRRPVREGPLVELDINGTVEKISRDGVFCEPVLLPRRSNRAEIILLADRDGSMAPFHGLSRQLVDTIKRGGLLQQTNVYYFHDYPSEYLYIDPARLTAKEIVDVLTSTGIHTTVLVISDAGAARGNLDGERIKQTNIFIQKLKQYVRRFAWINPLPYSRWPNTTAGEIARFVPMFDMSRRGLDDAVNALRGRYVYWEKLYPWMI